MLFKITIILLLFYYYNIICRHCIWVVFTVADAPTFKLQKLTNGMCLLQNVTWGVISIHDSTIENTY